MRKLTSKWFVLGLGIMGVVALSGFPAFASSTVGLVAAAATPFALQLKILAIAGSVYAILQVVKQVFPIAGVWAIVLNVVLSILGVAVVLKPEDLFSLPTFTTVAIAAISAAGAHGTIKSFRSGGPGVAGKSTGAGIVTSALTVILCLSLTACSVQGVLVTVQKSLPTAVKIATSILTIVNKAPLSSAQLQEINAGVALVADKLTLAHDLLADYNTAIKKDPNGGAELVSKIDAAVETAQRNADRLSTLCITCNVSQQQAIQFVTVTITGVIEEIISLLPASQSANAPHALARLAIKGVLPGDLKVKIKSAKELATQFNEGIKENFPQAQVQVP